MANAGLRHGPETFDMTTKLLAAISAAALLAFAAPVFAQDAADEETVSEAVDQTIWCGAFFSFAAQGAGETTDQGKLYTEAANAAYAQARVALEEDGIAEEEYDGIISYTVDLVVEDLTTEGAELRYSEDECIALVTP